MAELWPWDPWDLQSDMRPTSVFLCKNSDNDKKLFTENSYPSNLLHLLYGEDTVVRLVADPL